MESNNQSLNQNIQNQNQSAVLGNEQAVKNVNSFVNQTVGMSNNTYIPNAENTIINSETEYTKAMKQSFAFFGPVTLLYALLYAFCMFKNGSGITFFLFIGASLAYLYFALPKLGLGIKKGSMFYMASMLCLAVSTFCTDDWKIITLNKIMIFLLVMSLLLHQFFDTSKWQLGKYIGSILELMFCSIGELGRPFVDAISYYKKYQGKNKNVWYVVLGLVISLPLIVIVIFLLSGADAVFRELTNSILENINIGNIFNVCFRVSFMFFATYLLVAYLCKKTIREEVKDRRKGEPVLAITITSLLTIIYLLFSGIQIIYLFLGQMQLPEGYTYAEYAREGFFQLLAVSVLNLIIVLVCMGFFKESRVLKIVLTIMSACTFIMIVSSALRMVIYIRYYYMTFLRIFVLWSLIVLFLLFAGIVINIYKESFPLFKYSMVVITILYIILSFSHPDYIIASVNLASAPQSVNDNFEDNKNNSTFFLTDEPYKDFSYLTILSADAAPAIIPYMKKMGYDLKAYDDIKDEEGRRLNGDEYGYSWNMDGFGYYYLKNISKTCESFSLRTYNVSRHKALKLIEEN